MKLHISIILVLLTSLTSFAQEISPVPISIGSSGVVPGKAISLGKPDYPYIARIRRVGGQVQVKIVIDEKGNVTSAKALTGHSFLRLAAENAALESKFTPSLLAGKPIKVTGTIVFNFVQFTDWENIGGILAGVQEFIGTIATGSVEKASNEIVWVGFEKEKEEFFALQKDESTTAKAGRATILIKNLREKLKTLPATELWYFDLGYTISKLSITSRGLDRQTDFQSNLRELARLVNSVPQGIPPERLKPLAEAAKYSETRNLTKEERTNLVLKLIESRNTFLEGNQ